MIRFGLKYILVFVLVTCLVFWAHQYCLQTLEHIISLSLVKVYVFHTVTSLALCAVLVQLKSSTKYAEHIGFVYLASVVVKAILFFVIFRQSIFSDASLTNIEAASLLLPLFLGLFFEVLFLSRLLRQKPKIKNE